jgi:hypothetical protein
MCSIFLCCAAASDKEQTPHWESISCRCLPLHGLANHLLWESVGVIDVSRYQSWEVPRQQKLSSPYRIIQGLPSFCSDNTSTQNSRQNAKKLSRPVVPLGETAFRRWIFWDQSSFPFLLITANGAKSLKPACSGSNAPCAFTAQGLRFAR